MDLQSIPPELRRIVCEFKTPVLLQAQTVVDWRTVAQSTEKVIDHYSERDVRTRIAHEAANIVSIVKSDDSERGRVWRGRLYAMNDSTFWELLYAAYNEGQSSMRARFPMVRP